MRSMWPCRRQVGAPQPSQRLLQARPQVEHARRRGRKMFKTMPSSRGLRTSIGVTPFQTAKSTTEAKLA